LGENSPPPLFRDKLAQTKKLFKIARVFVLKKIHPPSKISGYAADFFAVMFTSCNILNAMINLDNMLVI